MKNLLKNKSAKTFVKFQAFSLPEKLQKEVKGGKDIIIVEVIDG